MNGVVMIKGDTIKCVKTSWERYLTVGKCYELLEIEKECVKIVCDLDYPTWFKVESFERVD